MRNLCVIPARGGSKRIPRKNIKEFLGKPILAYSIDLALASGLFSEIMVSTDDEEIAEIAKSHGAVVPFLRSMKNADDFATTADVIREVLDQYVKFEKTFNYICCLYPTAPLVKVGSIDHAFKVLTQGGFASVFPIVKFSYPIQRALKVDGQKVSMVWPEYEAARSQDLKSRYHDAGQFYWISAEFSTQNALFTANSSFIELDEMEVQDIDNLNDWRLAELKYKILNNEA